MLLMMEKGIESSYLTYLDAKSLYGWALSQKLPVNVFMWQNDHSSDFDEEFIRNHNENNDEGYFLEVDIEYSKQLWASHKELPFLPERRKLEKVETCLQYRGQRKICHTHKNLKASIN